MVVGKRDHTGAAGGCRGIGERGAVSVRKRLPVMPAKLGGGEGGLSREAVILTSESKKRFEEMIPFKNGKKEGEEGGPEYYRKKKTLKNKWE